MHAPAPAGRRATSTVLVALFAVATFLNAALLFAVEPMFTKMVLPMLGGTPSVWNTCLLFFQGALLVGYLYAHATSRWLSPSAQGLLHVTLLIVSLAFLPVAVSTRIAPPVGATLPIPWLLAILTLSLGLPFLLLSAGAPMLQRWFASTRHPAARNPYFLYVASNVGSFVALLAYPTIIEPRLRLSEQSATWLEFYYVLVALLVVALVATRRWQRKAPSGDELVMADAVADVSAETAAGAASAPSAGPHRLRRPLFLARSAADDAEPVPAEPSIVPTRAWRLRWLLLSFAPSSLLLGVTTFISTDLAAVPFFWIVPLALYLLTFVIVFARRPILHRGLMLVLQLFIGLALMVMISANPGIRLQELAMLHLLAFFATALVLHRELADSRPRAEYLTEFYLWISLGGVLGGLYNVVVAPMIYDRVLEYPYAMIIAFGLRPGRGGAGTRRDLFLDLVLPAALFAAIIAGYRLPTPPNEWGKYAVFAYLGVAALVAASFWKRPLRLALGAAAIYFGTQYGVRTDDDTLVQGRSFFGVYRVREWGEYHILQHGTTTHGGQSTFPARRTEPLTYYHREGPLGDIFAGVTDSVGPRSVALVGLGTGTTACYSRPGETWTYFEIDPVMVSIARTPALFTYLRDCQPGVRIVLGDARLSMARAADASFDLIALDAFSSDAIPVHLMTREALQLYLRKLKPGGVIAFHISNRYLDLRPVLVELARDARLAGALGDDDADAAQRLKLYYGSRWIALARDASTLAPLLKRENWRVLPPSARVRVWTDDFSDVLGVMRWR